MGAKFAAADLSRRLHVFTRGMEQKVVQYAEGEAPGWRCCACGWHVAIQGTLAAR
jgi:hypothetical protein